MPKKKEIKNKSIIKPAVEKTATNTVSISLEFAELPILQKILEIAKSGIPDSSIVLLADKIKAQLNRGK